MSQKNIMSVRSTIEFLKEQNEILTVKAEVDPIYEISGITKALDGGPALLFENIKSYPNARIVSNVFSTRERVAKIFDVTDHKRMKFKALEAINNPIPAKVVDSAPCQENIITEDIDVLNAIPVIKHTEDDAGRILGGGVVLVSGPEIGHDITFKRIHFRGKDWASLGFDLGTHLEYHLLRASQQKGRLPLTINICPSPAVWLTAGGGGVLLAIPAGTDELAIAGALQGSPVEIYRAKTVDAYAIASAEWVIEGYIDTDELVWESSDAEETGQIGKATFFPEFTGYVGRAWKTYKFQATAITHRKDKPIFHTPLAHSTEGFYLCQTIREAGVYDACNRIYPGLVIDVNMLDAFGGNTGIVIQVRKRRRRDEGYQRNMVEAAFAACPFLRLVIVVDEDINIYNAEDVLFAINSRMNPIADLMIVSEVRGDPTSPMGRTEGAERTGISSKMGIDATVPYGQKWLFTRSRYADADLSKWLTSEEIAWARAFQSEYARFFAEIRT
ncbi:MAG: UbiD family decarboxylase [Deltaproteobacteria bacterium]|nr:MAG: UbiD family decarboxylase [Deltaproteobacteria bacterium]